MDDAKSPEEQVREKRTLRKRPVKKAKKKAGKRKAAKRSKGKKKLARKVPAKKVAAITTTERLDIRLPKAAKVKLNAKAAKTRRTITSVVVELIERMR